MAELELEFKRHWKVCIVWKKIAGDPFLFYSADGGGVKIMSWGGGGVEDSRGCGWDMGRGDVPIVRDLVKFLTSST
jgi:hypothetical protein